MRWTASGIAEDRTKGGSEECNPLFRVAPNDATTTTTTTRMIATTISTVVFGVELASILDWLLCVQATDMGFIRLGTTLPFIGAFTRLTGCLRYEANMLTRHYYACGISLYCAMQSDAALAGVAALFRAGRDARHGAGRWAPRRTPQRAHHAQCAPDAPRVLVGTRGLRDDNHDVW